MPANLPRELKRQVSNDLLKEVNCLYLERVWALLHIVDRTPEQYRDARPEDNSFFQRKMSIRQFPCGIGAWCVTGIEMVKFEEHKIQNDIIIKVALLLKTIFHFLKKSFVWLNLGV